MNHYPKMIYKDGQLSSDQANQRIVKDAEEEEAAVADGFLRFDPERDSGDSSAPATSTAQAPAAPAKRKRSQQ